MVKRLYNIHILIQSQKQRFNCQSFTGAFSPLLSKFQFGTYCRTVWLFAMEQWYRIKNNGAILLLSSWSTSMYYFMLFKIKIPLKLYPAIISMLVYTYVCMYCISYAIISKKIGHDVSVNHLTTHHLPLMLHRGTLILVNLQQQRNAWHNRKLPHCTKASNSKCLYHTYMGIVPGWHGSVGIIWGLLNMVDFTVKNRRPIHAQSRYYNRTVSMA